MPQISAPSCFAIALISCDVIVEIPFVDKNLITFLFYHLKSLISMNATPSFLHFSPNSILSEMKIFVNALTENG
jgi:hypothetical protein